jgi:hypothetical protein
MQSNILRNDPCISAKLTFLRGAVKAISVGDYVVKKRKIFVPGKPASF